MNLIITEEEVAKARESWGNALVKISIAFEERGIEAARKLASDAIDSVYGYGIGPVYSNRRWRVESRHSVLPKMELWHTSLDTAMNILSTEALELKGGVK